MTTGRINREAFRESMREQREAAVAGGAAPAPAIGLADHAGDLVGARSQPLERGDCERGRAEERDAQRSGLGRAQNRCPLGEEAASSSSSRSCFLRFLA